MIIACISDQHGELLEPAECDLLLLGGDYPPDHGNMENWFRETFAKWLWRARKKAAAIVGIAGNHDEPFDDDGFRRKTMCYWDWEYLQDRMTTVEGLKIYGMPWTRQAGGNIWPFQTTESVIAERLAKIPDGVDILLTHGPPFRCLDMNPLGEHCGSQALRDWIQEHQPKLVVCGHIHPGYGVDRLGHMGETLVVNAAQRSSIVKANPAILVDTETWTVLETCSPASTTADTLPTSEEDFSKT